MLFWTPILEYIKIRPSPISKLSPDALVQMLIQWRSQNAEKIHTSKGDYWIKQIVINCLPFQNGNFSKRKEFALRGSEFFPLKAILYGMENHFYHNR